MPWRGQQDAGAGSAERGEPSLEALEGGRVVFASHGRWLHPLFELEGFLGRGGHDPALLVVRDKVVGKAAALLLVRLGVRQVEARVLSRPGEQVFGRWGVTYRAARVVERIDCRTEELLEGVENADEARLILARLAGRA